MKIKRLGLGFSAVALTLATVATPVAGAWADEAAGGSGTIINSCGDSDALCVTKYEDLVSALANVNIAEIRLDADILVSSKLTVSRAVALDLNGKTLTFGDGTADINMAVTSTGDLTLKDSLGGGKMEFKFKSNSYGSSGIAVSGKVTMASGKIVMTQGYGIYLYDGGVATVNGGEIDTSNGVGAAIGGNNTTGEMYAYINGGVLKSKYVAVFMPSQVELKVAGGELYGGITARMGQITISDDAKIYSSEQRDDLDSIIDEYSGSGFPWLGNAVSVLAGTYDKGDKEHGNSLNLTINGGELIARTDSGSALAIYEMGHVAQSINTTITGGKFTVNDKATSAVATYKIADLVSAAGKTLKSGYGVIDNKVNLAISGGTFNKKVDETAIAEGYVIARDVNDNDLYKVVSPTDETDDIDVEETQDGDLIILPSEMDLHDQEAVKAESSATGIAARVRFDKSFVTDRKATLKVAAAATSELTVKEDAAADIVAAFEIGLFDRDDVEIEVKDSEITVTVFLTKEQYETLSKFDNVKMIYFDENGNEKERLDAKIYADEDSEGEMTYSLMFATTHFSTYAAAGVNNAGEATPNTGVFTAQSVGASEVAMTTGAMALVSTIIVLYGAIKFAKN